MAKTLGKLCSPAVYDIRKIVDIYGFSVGNAVLGVPPVYTDSRKGCPYDFF